MKKAYVISYTVGCIVSIAFTSLVTKRISIQDAALILPLITFFLLLFVWKKLRRKTKTIEVIMTAYATGAIIYTFLSNVSSFTLDAFSITIVVYFVLQTTFAIKSPNATQNYTFGIRNPMTLDHVEVWQSAGFPPDPQQKPPLRLLRYAHDHRAGLQEGFDDPLFEGLQIDLIGGGRNEETDAVLDLAAFEDRCRDPQLVDPAVVAGTEEGLVDLHLREVF